jgi:hypothetical protein
LQWVDLKITKLTQKESVKKKLRLFNYKFSKFIVFSNSITTSQIFELSDLDLTVAALQLQLLAPQLQQLRLYKAWRDLLIYQILNDRLKKFYNYEK